ncbi:MAG: hypothetical protein WBE72_01090 [Terracidiphilus sp.]
MCKVTDAMIVADGAAVGTALENLGAAVATTDPSLSTSLESAGKAVVAATANWQTGDVLTDIETAEQAAIVVLNVIPLTAPIAPLVAIAFAALNVLIANLQTQPGTAANPSTETVSAHTLLARAATLNTDSPWYGKAAIKHHWLNPPRKDFESAWNSAAVPLGVATITV